MMFKLAIAALFLVGSIHCEASKTAAASNHRAFFARPRPSQAVVRPQTPSGSHSSFHCQNKPHIPGMYADESNGCKSFHYCTETADNEINCGEGSLFSQKHLICMYPVNVTCSDSKKYYGSTAGIGVETGLPSEPELVSSFDCAAAPYKVGIYADMESNCAQFINCTPDEKTVRKCGEGTFFNQKTLTCEYAENFVCADSPKYYDANEPVVKSNQY